MDLILTWISTGKKGILKALLVLEQQPSSKENRYVNTNKENTRFDCGVRTIVPTFPTAELHSSLGFTKYSLHILWSSLLSSLQYYSWTIPLEWPIHLSINYEPFIHISYPTIVLLWGYKRLLTSYERLP
jgi:hypothetical protein